MVNKWDDDKRYEKIACSLVGQCADEKLTVEESRFVIELALQQINWYGETASLNERRAESGLPRVDEAAFDKVYVSKERIEAARKALKKYINEDFRPRSYQFKLGFEVPKGIAFSSINPVALNRDSKKETKL